MRASSCAPRYGGMGLECARAGRAGAGPRALGVAGGDGSQGQAVPGGGQAAPQGSCRAARVPAPPAGGGLPAPHHGCQPAGTTPTEPCRAEYHQAPLVKGMVRPKPILPQQNEWKRGGESITVV